MNLENSLFKVIPQRLEKTIEVPTSKSYANRALVLAALRGNGTTVYNIPNSTDVQNLLKAFTKIGLKFETIENRISFSNSFPLCETLTSGEFVDLETGDGGTTNRFLIALLSRGKKNYRLFPSEKMAERPIEDLIFPLKNLGVFFEQPKTGPWLVLKGPADITIAKNITVNCDKSTQFASALLLAFHETPVAFSFHNLKSSEKYLRMTEAILKEKEFLTPVDFSSLSYPLSLALVEGKVLIKNCTQLDHFQADAILIELMKKSGASISFTKLGLEVNGEYKLSPFKIDGSICPDLVPTLAFIASKIEGTSYLENLSTLRFKESDRLLEIMKLLENFAVNFSFDPLTSSLTITGSTKKAPPVTYIPPRDHRLVMTAYLFMRANSGGLLGNTDCVEKSYPHFFKDLEN